MATQDHILIVEDEPNTAEMLASYFEAQGYQVTTVGWGKDALAFVKKTLPDLVVLDIRLPDIDGYEICRQLRSQRRTAHVPIIFLTERRERIDRLAGLELGAVDYVTKPFDIQELRLRVSNVLQRAKLPPVSHPVTGLAFAELAEERLSSLVKEGGRWAVLTIGLRGLEEFADTYGFVARDDMLRAVALMVQRVADAEPRHGEHFVGQLDSARFFVIVDPGYAQRLQEQLAARLKEAMSFFYPRADWEAGHSEDGKPLPQLSLRMGVVTDPGSYKSLTKLRQAMSKSLRPV